MDFRPQFWSRFWSNTWSFSWPTRLTWFTWLSGFKLSYGVWFKLTRDAVVIRANAVSATEYIYKAVGEDEVRLLMLQPGEFSDPLKATFEVHKLKRPIVPYNAISYVWADARGDPYSLMSTIEVNGEGLRVVNNGSEALRHIRSTTTTTVCWLDCVCINQSDIEDKRTQVAHMDQIYSMASQVIIWLQPGRDQPDVVPGLKVISHLTSYTDFKESQPWVTLPQNLLHDSLSTLMSHAWFERVWVVQEAVMAQKIRIQAGPYSVSWPASATSRLYTRLKFCEIIPSWHKAGLSSVNMTPLAELIELIQVRNVGFQPRISTLDIMHNLRRRQATHFSDRLFALMKLVGDIPEELLSYSAPAEEVYDGLFEHIYAQYKDQSEAIHDGVKHDYRVQVYEHLMLGHVRGTGDHIRALS